MTSLLNAHLPSDDEDESEDDDYNPLADKTAEREDIHQEPKAAGRGGAKKRRRGGALAAGDGEAGAASGSEDGDDDGEADEEEDAAAAEEAARNDPRAVAKREKIASLWQQINSNAASRGTGSAAGRLPSAGVTLAELCTSATAERLRAKRPKKAAPDEIWMRSLGLLPKSSARSGSPAVAAAAVAAIAALAPATAAAAAAAAAGVGASGSGQELGRDSASPEPGAAGGGLSEEAAAEKRALAAAALAAARDAKATGSRVGKVAVTETRRFAGKDIQVTMMVDKDSKEAERAAARAAVPPPKPTSKGLDAMLAEIEKKKKVSVLDKTKADWSQYKAVHTEVDEELEEHKKSGDQYLDKQNFLKRAELREYEKERDTRLASDIRTRGRL
ncbi:hypothetical protein HYH02_007006 [Chlamydomonas schloesseri]|uniref:BCNT-C domain-containing protein n=1 Tax=Chlamydomonas schloesseri TaxID=2026947 RepID=A0A835WIF6_9CHLO|nr:hypothetical protein HYH02_007006 [Chlamydomonas schloesseri]|eukprot:KAG2447977.1 hypothetical protein HYH02_007006 [Chlamydomonas schloesseri]